MPRFATGPANPWFGHLIGDDGMVPAADVQIYWNTENIQNGHGDGEAPRVKDVAVFLLPRELLRDLKNDDEDHPVWDRLSDVDDAFVSSSGNAFTDWLTTDKDRHEQFADLWEAPLEEWTHNCPDNLWLWLTSEFGFLNDAEARRAREEFARIAECEWARNPEWPTPAARPWTPEDDARLALEKRNRANAAERRRLNPPPPLGAIDYSDIKFPPSEEEEKRMAEGDAWRKREDELIAAQQARDLLG